MLFYLLSLNINNSNFIRFDSAEVVGSRPGRWFWLFYLLGVQHYFHSSFLFPSDVQMRWKVGGRQMINKRQNINIFTLWRFTITVYKTYFKYGVIGYGSTIFDWVYYVVKYTSNFVVGRLPFKTRMMLLKMTCSLKYRIWP